MVHKACMSVIAQLYWITALLANCCSCNCNLNELFQCHPKLKAHYTTVGDIHTKMIVVNLKIYYTSRAQIVTETMDLQHVGVCACSLLICDHLAFTITQRFVRTQAVSLCPSRYGDTFLSVADCSVFPRYEFSTGQTSMYIH